MNDVEGVHRAWAGPTGRKRPRRSWHDFRRHAGGMQVFPASRIPDALSMDPDADFDHGMDNPTTFAATRG